MRSLLLAVGLVLSSGSVSATSGYVQTPFDDSAPWMSAAWSALQPGQEDATGKQRAAVVALDNALNSPAPEGALGSPDPLLELTARWLRARLHHALGDARAAAQDDVQLLASGSSLANPLRQERAEVAIRDGDGLRAAELLAGTTPGTLPHFRAIQRAAGLFRKAGELRRAAEALDRALRGPLSSNARVELSLMMVEVHREMGEVEAADRLLKRMWWSAPSSVVGQRIKKVLELHEKPIGPLETLARRVILATRRGVGEVRAAVRKVPRRTRQQKRFRTWAMAVLDRHDAKLREVAARSLDRIARGWSDDVLAPWYVYGQGLVWRKLDRNLEAAAAYSLLAEQWPDHVLVPDALISAGTLLSGEGLAAEADARFRRVVRRDELGTADRSALWWVAFHGLLRGDGEEAEVLLRRLRQRYGGDREGTGLVWEERALYWLGRALVLSNKRGEAERIYRETSRRFPMSWYGVLARQRLAELRQGAVLPVPTVGRVVETPGVVRTAALDLPVALSRLGETDRAIREMEALVASGQLSGSGRSLLARLYRSLSRDDLAERTLNRGGVLAEVPSPSDLATYERLFPMEHRELLEAAAQREGLPEALVAGLIYVESRFNHRAVSSAGAMGLMQLMPGTARVVGRKSLGKKISRRMLKDPTTNLEVGSRLLAELITHFRGNVPVALAGYNAGRGAARSWLRQRGHLPVDAFVETMPYTQARRYAMRVVASASVYGALRGLKGAPVPVSATPPLTLDAFMEPSAAPKDSKP